MITLTLSAELDGKTHCAVAELEEEEFESLTSDDAKRDNFFKIMLADLHDYRKKAHNK